MKSKMKRTMSIILTFTICLLMFAGCGNTNSGSSSSSPSSESAAVSLDSADSSSDAGDANGSEEPRAEVPEPCTVAIAVGTYNAQTLKAQKYFNEYLSKELNVNFIFSEELGSDVSKNLAFVENAYSVGAQGVIDWAMLSGDDIIPIAEKCEQLGLYFSTWLVGALDGISHLEHVVGVAANNDAVIDELFGEMIKEVLGDGEKHNLVLATAGAHSGSKQQVITSVGILEAYRDMYGLTYSDDMEKLAMLDSVTEIETGVDDVKITIFPKFTGDELSNVLKNGEYDVVAVVANLYLRFESVIKEIEEANKMDIKVITVTEIADTTYNSFNTLDSSGNPSIDAALLTTSGKISLTLALVLNGIYGDRDAILIDGKPATYNNQSWICYSPEEYEAINKVDTSEDTYIYNAEEFKQMIKFYNEDLTAKSLMDYAQEYSSKESVFERRVFN